MDVRHYAFLARQPSAAVKTREHFWGMPKRGLAFLLANVMFWQPVWAQAEGIVVATPGTSLGQAGNGVPIVNIATPNGTGLSHNQFHDYNVGTQGVILNNVAAQTGATQLGGIIVGNPNLTNRVAAQTILNEVVGGSPSQLRGYTEVAGQSARVIVANPYGISCNGCGFINTPRVTLTTGKPVLDNGRVDRYQVDQGSVSIDGTGLNATNVDSFEIITRSAKINAEIQAKNLTIVAGRNDVNAQTLNATARADDGSAKPQLAIDSSALGGMYAGAIKLVGTEAGVGVKLAGNLAASGGDIQIDANGHLSMAQTSASGAVSAKAASLDTVGPVYAGTSLSVNTSGDINTRQNVAARDSITLNSGGQLTNTGVIEAGINADNSRNANGDVTINAQNLRNTGSINASRSLQADVTQTLNNQGGTLNSQTRTQVTAATLDNRSGRVLSQGSLGVTADQLLNAQSGLVSSTGNLSVSAGYLDNSQQGKFSSTDALTVHTSGQLLNQLGIFSASGNLLLSAGSLDNRNGEISSLSDLSARGGQANNSGNGRLLANGDVTLTFDGLNNQNKGAISGQRDVQLNVGQLTNDGVGSVYAKRNLDLNVTNALNNRQGVLRSDGTLNLHAASLDNNGGSVTSAGASTLATVGALTNQGGVVLSDASLTLTSASLDNSQKGRIAGKGLVVKTGAFDNRQSGSLTSTGVLQLTAGQVNNSDAGRIASAMALTATVTGLDQSNDGHLYGDSDVSLDLSNGVLNNQNGLITAPGQLLLKNLNIVNNQSGEVSSAHGFTLAAKTLQNTEGSVISDKALIVRIDQQLTNIKGLVSGTGVDLSATELNNDSGSVSSDADLSVHASGQVSNQNGELSAAGNTTLTAASLNNASGHVTADQRLNMTVDAAIDNQAGTLGAANGIVLQAASLDNRQSGVVVTDGDLGITLTGILNNQSGGSVQAKGPIDLKSLTLDNRGGRVSSKSLLTLRSATTDNRGGLIRANHDMQLFVDHLDNRQQGVVSSKAGLALTGQRLDNQGGLLRAVGLMQLQLGSVLNDAGRIASQGDLTANIDNLSQHGGAFVAKGNLTLTGSQLVNRAGGLVGATKALKLNVADIDNRAGEMSSQVDVAVTSQQLNNSDGGKVLAGTALTLTVDRLLNQTKGLLSGDTLQLKGASLDNSHGTLSSQSGLKVELTGALDNSAGLLSSEAALTVNADSLENASGKLSSANALNLTTAGALRNQGGSITTDAQLNVRSASLDNRNSGELAGKGATRVDTGAFDNSQGGRLTSSNTLNLTAGQVTNQNGGRIASALSLNATVTGLDQQAGELFSNTALSLDLNHGQLNNQGGLINSPGALLLKNLKGVANQNGEISSGQAFTLAAQNLDNSGGKLLSNQGLTLRIAQVLNNLKGAVSAAGLDITSASLDNTEGLLSSRDGLNLTVDSALTNHKGTLIADSDLLLTAATTDNSQGQISSKKNLTAQIGSLQQQGGQLIAQGSLTLTGNTLDNRQNGLVGATSAMNINVDNIDNRGGELSSQDAITLNGQQLDNSDNGKLLAQKALTLNVAQMTNRNNGLLSGKSGLKAVGTSLDNTGGSLVGLKGIDINLSGALDNSQGLISSEDTLGLHVGSLSNIGGNVSSAGLMTLDSVGALNNQGGELVTDGALDLRSASLDNRAQGSISSKGALSIRTGDFDNSQSGRVSTGDQLDLTAAQLTNRDAGSIGSGKALVASVSGLDQRNGKLFSNTALTLDMNNGQLNNQGGLINAPGSLLLKNLNEVLNLGGEISSAQAFTLAAQSLDNSGGKLLSNQDLTVRVAQALNNVKGMIAAARIDARADTLDNSGGTLTSRGDLELTSNGLLINRDDGLISATQALKVRAANLDNQAGQLLGKSALTVNTSALNNTANGLINSQGTLNLTAASLDSSNGGEVSAHGDMSLVVNALTQTGGRLLSDAGLTLDMNGADLNNRNGLIIAKGPLSLNRLKDLNNQGGEISSSQSFTLAGGNLDNSNGKLISNNLLTLNASTLLNHNGLMSGWQGLSVNGGILDNRNNGTLSSRNGDVSANLSDALLNGNGGALVSQKALSVSALSLDNRGGILSSGAGQTLTVSGVLDNSLNGLIDSGAALTVQASTLNNATGNITAQQDFSLVGSALDNSGGNLSSKGAVTLDLLGALTNTNGKLASGGALLLRRSSQIDNQGGQLVSQSLMTLNTGSLDNRNRGTVAASNSLILTTSGAVLNSADGLIYSQNADVQLQAGSLSNARGTLQSQSALSVNVSGDIDNQNGRIIAQGGDLGINAATLDSRGGVLSSLQGAFNAHVTGVLKNGYDLNRQGGVIQAQRLNLTALAGFDNDGGRVSARTGDALVTTSNFDNRNGGLYAKSRVSVTANPFDNSGGQIAGGQIDLNLSGALNNRLGIIESDNALSVTASNVDNQTGKLRALGQASATQFNIGGAFDNRNGVLESANSDLNFNVGSFLNAGGSLLHVGAGNFGISTANVTNAGGSIVTRGGLTLNADSWTNSSVIQAGRLTVNVNNFSQTASGQLLASSAFVGTGGNWYNDGLIASDGTLSLNIGGTYSGNGRMTSLGNLNVGAAQLNLSNAASIAGGGSTSINVGGQLTNYGRLTSAADLAVNAGGISNYGTLGAAQSLTLTTPTLLNSQGLIFSGANMQLNVASFSNRKGDLYGLGNVTISGYGSAQAGLVSNVSGSMESAGRFAISAASFENRTEGSDGVQNFGVGRTLVKGSIAVQCFDCSGDRYEVNYIVRETYSAGVDSDNTASAQLMAGGDFVFNGGNFLNSKSTIAAVGNISIQADNVKNIGAVSGAVERTRVYKQGGAEQEAFGDNVRRYFLPLVDGYNQHNNPDFPKVYYVDATGALVLGTPYSATFRQGGGKGEHEDFKYIGIKDSNGVAVGSYRYPNTLVGYQWGTTPISLYDPANLVALPSAIDGLKKIDDKEVSLNGTGNAGRSAVIQAGGNVSITATTDVQNSVIRHDYTVGGGTNKVQDTRSSASGGTTVVRINAQLPPDLAQQQVNPLGLPGFSLPTGQNGLFRLSGQSGSNTQATQAGTAPQNWTIAGASVSVAQREQAVPDLQARDIQIGSVGQVSTATRQLATATRQGLAVSANASTFDTSAPADSGNGDLPVPEHRSDSTGVTTVGNVIGETGVTPTGSAAGVQTGVAALPGIVVLPGQNAVQAVTSPAITQVAPTATQTLTRVQGVPSSTAPPNSHKYLIETNPVLTDLKQFMSSDYLLAGLGYDPDISAKRLGDGLYEQRLIQQAVTARTGQAFIDGQTSNQDQFKYLMNNAIASKSALNLAVGVTLTSQQVAALTHDIVWLEEHEVNGEKVLVPVLYLAQADHRLGPNGALIAGKDVSLIAGQNLDNVGTLRATNNLSAQAGNDLVNSGLIEAGNRLDLLAGNDIINKAGGIIKGRDVSLTAINGDIVNERTMTSQDNNLAGQRHNDYADNAARIEAANDMSASAGRDINNLGSVLQSGRDLTLKAGRDVNIVPTQVSNSVVLDSRHTKSDITQLGSTASAGRDLSVQAGRDINVIASQIDAKRDITMAATENLTIGSAADEEHFLSKSKKLTVQEDHVSQVMSGITAGGSVKLDAGKDLAVISSRITAGDEAYLVAGNNLDILAAQDSDYSLYDKKKKGSFGAKKTKRDEVTDVKNIGSEITAGGDLTLVSGGDQRYQVAKLSSEKDITLESGGAITFEGVKDYHDESHTKSDGDAFWTSSKGKGNTDETLRQTQMIAKGDVTIKAVDGLHIDLKQINQDTVSQSIDAMVKADPQLAWLKDAEKRGDVDWRLVKEIHQSFKYENSGLGPASQIIIAIALAAVMGPMMAGMNTMLQAVAVSAATKATVSTIDNRGNLGKVVKDVTSKDSIKGYVVAAATAGVAQGLNYSPGSLGFDVKSLNTVVAKVTADAVIKTAVYGGSFKDNLASSAAGTAASIGGAVGAGKIGNMVLAEGGIEKIILHAGLGGLLAEAMGGDFRTGALAGGANELLVGLLGDKLLPSNLVPGSADYNQAQANILAISQLVGVLGAVASGGDVGIASSVAANATQNNYLSHDQLQRAARKLSTCKTDAECTNLAQEFRDISKEQDIDAIKNCVFAVELCRPTSLDVANTMADLNKVKDALGDSSPAAERTLQALINENHDFQQILAMAAGGHSADALAGALQAKWNLSNEQTNLLRDNLGMIAAVGAGVAAVSGKAVVDSLRSGSGKGKTNAQAASSTTVGEGSKVDEGTGWPKVVVRSDSDFTSPINDKGKPKAYINDDGDLVPPNPNGTGSVQSHVRGGNSENSPYISTTDPKAVSEPKEYGQNKIVIDVEGMQRDIDSGSLKNTQVLTSQQVRRELQLKIDQAQERYAANSSDKNLRSLEGAKKDLDNATRDGECLIRGCVPAKYINPAER
jgi:filamentous hemagglutinin